MSVIADLLKTKANISVTISLDDLREFLTELVENSIAEAQAHAEVEHPNDLMTRDEVCEYLGVTKPTLHRWNKQGYLTCIKVGSKVRYNRKDIEAFNNHPDRYRTMDPVVGKQGGRKPKQS